MKWTEEEEEIIREYYSEMGPIGIHRAGLLPNRSYNAIRVKGSQMGIPSIPHWEDSEIEILRLHYPNLGPRGIEEANLLPNRSRYAVKSAAQTHGVSYNRRDNETVDLGNESSEIILRNIKGEEVGRAIVDTKDLEDILSYGQWSISVRLGRGGNEYAQTMMPDRKKLLHMHRLVMRLHGHDIDDPSDHVDHINGNGLDNRYENLRFLDSALNSSRHYRRRTHAIHQDLPRGVTRNKTTKKPYTAQVGYGGKVANLGSYADPEEASTAYITMKMLLYWDRREALESFPEPTTKITPYMLEKLEHQWCRCVGNDEFERRLAALITERVLGE